MLDALSLVLSQIFLDLRLVVEALVDRDADLAAGRGQCTRDQPRQLALDVEEADFAEVEQLLVEQRPMVHAPAVHIVGEVIEIMKPGRLGMWIAQGLS